MASKGKGKESSQMQCSRCGGVNNDISVFMKCCKSSRFTEVERHKYWPDIKRQDASGVTKNPTARESCEALTERLLDATRAPAVAPSGDKGKKKGNNKSKAPAKGGASVREPSADDKAVANEIIIAVQSTYDDNCERRLAKANGHEIKLLEEPLFRGTHLTKDICEKAFQIIDAHIVQEGIAEATAARPYLDTSPIPGSATSGNANVRSLTGAMARSGLNAQSSNINEEPEDSGEPKGLIARLCRQDESHRNRMPIYKMPQQVSTSKEGMPASTRGGNVQQDFRPAELEAARAVVLDRIAKNQTTKADLKESELHELRQSLVEPDTDYQVLTNHFKVDIPAGTKLYEYQVLNIPESASRSKKAVFIRDMIEVDRTLWLARADFASDYKKKIISRKPLFVEDAVVDTFVASIAVNNFSAGTMNNMPAQLTLNLQLSAIHDLDGMNNFVLGKDEGYRAAAAAEALNIIIGKAVTGHSANSDTFQVGNNRFFYRPGWQDLNVQQSNKTGLVAIRGYYSSIKPAMNAVLLNVNTVNSVFYKAQNLASYFGNHGKKGEMPLPVFQEFQSHLSGLRVWLNFKREGPDGQGPEIDSPARRVKTMCELGKIPTSQRFTQGENKVFVWDHVNSKYPHAINQADRTLPAVNVGRKDDPHRKYYLAHQFDVLADQPYRHQLSSEMTSAMIKAARRDPDQSCRDIIDEGLAALLPAFEDALDGEINLDDNMMSVAARCITAPRINYRAGEHANARGGFWDIEDRQFVGQLRKFDATRAVASVQFFKSTDNFFAENYFSDAYAKCFINANKKYGLQPMTCSKGTATHHMIHLESSEENAVRDQVVKHKANSLVVLVFDKNAAAQRTLYANFKIVTDQLLGIKSICICEDRVLSSWNVKPDRQTGIRPNPTKSDADISELPELTADYFRNLAMKVNLRAGNFNHAISAQDLPVIGAEVCDTIILGADVTHPSPGSVDGTPSIAAVVGSVPTSEHNFAHFAGSMRLNTPRKDIVADMEQMAKERLEAWASAQDHLPSQILFYRDGVSSSQYAEVREREIQSIRQAWRQLSREKYGEEADPELPKITSVVVTKRHHTRFYPKIKSHPKNCPVGTVVDSAITSPYYFDFYLLSHNAPAGTAKPAHYFVLENGIGFTEKQLQDLTFKLCFMYCKSSCSVSYAPPAYYADRLCERGRLYLQPFFDQIKNKANKKYYEQLSPEDVFKNAAEIFYRGGGRTPGLPANPWHVNHDGIMFWM